MPKHEQPSSPQLLVSVRDLDEATAALAGGADWIDCKEPRRGALGAVDVGSVTRIVELIADQRPLSAALGEMVDIPDSAHTGLLRVNGVSVVKLGLSHCRSLSDWRARWRELYVGAQQHRKELAAVVYADWKSCCAPAPQAIVELAIQCGCRFLLVDTFAKNGRTTLQLMTSRQLAGLVSLAKRHRLAVVLAGGLQYHDLGSLQTRDFDLIAVRGAVCRNGRTGAVDSELVMRFSARLRRLHLESEQARRSASAKL